MSICSSSDKKPKRILKIIAKDQTKLKGIITEPDNKTSEPTLSSTTTIHNHNHNHNHTHTNETLRESITTDYCDPSLFQERQIHRIITIPFLEISRTKNIQKILTCELSDRLDGKCSNEGYICPNSIQLIRHSCGTLAGANITFDVDLKCLICLPNEQTKIICVAKTITQAGIRGVAKGLNTGTVSPIEVFISRDMNMKNAKLFNEVREGYSLCVEIIARRFVLNDSHVTIIAMLHEILNIPASRKP